jgi:hypothetical protein
LHGFNLFFSNRLQRLASLGVLHPCLPILLGHCFRVIHAAAVYVAGPFTLFRQHCFSLQLDRVTFPGRFPTQTAIARSLTLAVSFCVFSGLVFFTHGLVRLKVIEIVLASSAGWNPSPNETSWGHELGVR